MNIYTNVMSMYSRNNLNKTQSEIETIMQRLSSGSKINSAKDDAAGMAITERLNTIIRGNNQGIKNIEDGLSMVQVADGGLDGIQNQFQRIRELLIQAKNGTYNEQDLKSMEQEVNQIKSGIDNIAATTLFNGINLLKREINPAYYQVVYDETAAAFTLNPKANRTTTINVPTVGPDVQNSTLTITVDNAQFERDYAVINSGPIYSDKGSSGHTTIQSMDVDKIIASATLRIYVKGDLAPPNEWLDTYVNGAKVGGKFMPGEGAAEKYMGEYDVSAALAGQSHIELKTVGGNLGGDGVDGGSARYELEMTYTNGEIYKEVKSLRTQLIDEEGKVVSERKATSNTETFMITNPDAGNWRVRVFSDEDYEVSDTVTINKKFETSEEAEGIVFIHGGYEVENRKEIQLTNITSILALTDGMVVGSEGAIQAVDNAIEEVSKQRAKYGMYANALQSRLEYNSGNVIETTSARSRIEDADMARETAAMTKEKIIANSAMSMLLQANSNPERIVDLLRQ